MTAVTALPSWPGRNAEVFGKCSEDAGASSGFRSIMAARNGNVRQASESRAGGGLKSCDVLKMDRTNRQCSGHCGNKEYSGSCRKGGLG